MLLQALGGFHSHIPFKLVFRSEYSLHHGFHGVNLLDFLQHALAGGLVGLRLIGAFPLSNPLSLSELPVYTMTKEAHPVQ